MYNKIEGATQILQTYHNIPNYTANIANSTKYSKDMTKYSQAYCWAAPAIGICG